MAKNLKLKIKNTQLAKAAGLDKLKAKLSGEEKKEKKAKPKAPKAKPKAKAKAEELAPEVTEEVKPRVRAKSKSAFAKEEEKVEAEVPAVEPEPTPEPEPAPAPAPVEQTPEPVKEEVKAEEPKVKIKEKKTPPPAPKKDEPKKPAQPAKPAYEKLGPTGRHIKDILPPKKEKPKTESGAKKPGSTEAPKKELRKGKKVRDFKDLKPGRRQETRGFNARDRQGLSDRDDGRWRKRRQTTRRRPEEHEIVRPSELTIRLPITVKDLASEMKLKSSAIIQKLFLQGMTFTLNDPLDDETTVQFIGSEFGCAITVDTTEEERIQITAESVGEEIAKSTPEQLEFRPPVVAFMGHVDHGKTSLIDAIRKSNIVSGESGAITQHIGAFRCSTSVGDLTVLDTPGHEAFSAMRARGAEVTDIVVLVVAGDEGLRDQTVEAIHHAKAAGVTIVVAINKCDKPNFNAENVYRELSEIELLPEAWGGTTITVNTSAVSGEGVQALLEMLALQAEVLELKANPEMRARGTVLESELHKGLGNVTTVLVQNGTLNHGDALVFQRHWGRVKTMHDEHGALLETAGPSTPVELTGLSGLPSAGDPFIVVKSEKEARDIVETREVGREQQALAARKLPTFETLLQEGEGSKKVLKLILRADVQGSCEALRTSILKIESDKAEADIIFMGVGEISESDVQLAAASNAIIIGFHSAVESHAEPLIKELGVTIRLFDVIYHAIDEVKALMLGLLDKIAEEKETGRADVQATFKSSHLGVIAGCLIADGLIKRNHKARLLRDGEEVWHGNIASIKRGKEDVKEIKKGFECGILLENFNAIEEGDVIQAYEIIYKSQDL